jgi:hypothetical protein
MFDLQIDKKKKQKNKKLSSMNKSCEKKQQHIVKIFYMWMFGSTEKQFLGPNRKVVADRAGTNVRK